MKTLKLITPFIVALAVLVAVYVDMASLHVTKAEAPFFQSYFPTAGTASTSVTYMTAGAASAGTATTSLIVDAQQNGFDNLSLLIQLTASSAAPTLMWRYEFAQTGTECDDTPSNCDWYPESVQNNASTATTTTEVLTFKEYSWKFASSTPGGQASTTNIAYKYIAIPTPTRFTRVLFYLAPGSSNGALWMQGVGKKEVVN